MPIEGLALGEGNVLFPAVFAHMPVSLSAGFLSPAALMALLCARALLWGWAPCPMWAGLSCAHGLCTMCQAVILRSPLKCLMELFADLKGNWHGGTEKDSLLGFCSKMFREVVYHMTSSRMSCKGHPGFGSHRGTRCLWMFCTKVI